jgi:hypothetical protein
MLEDIIHLFSIFLCNIKNSTISILKRSQSFDLISYGVRNVPSQQSPNEAWTVESILKVDLVSDAVFLTVQKRSIS